jgi:hypothetical protein
LAPLSSKQCLGSEEQKVLNTVKKQVDLQHFKAKMLLRLGTLLQFVKTSLSQFHGIKVHKII